jgi:hypothetical protein
MLSNSIELYNHHILIVNNAKYELRKNNGAMAYYNTDHYGIDHEARLHAREAGLASDGAHHIYLIGWIP